MNLGAFTMSGGYNDLLGHVVPQWPIRRFTAVSLLYPGAVGISPLLFYYHDVQTPDCD